MFSIRRNFYLYIFINLGACSSTYMRNTKEWAAARGGWGAAGPACEDALGRLALVEHFFSLVFAEFQRAPPACVCVQMCEQQATYCYPNGCLRREPPRAATPPAPAPADAANAAVEPVESDKLLPVGLRSERYEDIFKAAYNPSKIGFKYNGRDQPRHRGIISMLKDQENELSVVKSRWPMKKYYGTEPTNNNDLSRGESFGRNFFFSNFYDDKETVMLNQNSKRATNHTRQRVLVGDGLNAGLLVRVGPFDHTTERDDQYTRLYNLDHHQPQTTTHTATHTITHTATHTTTPPAATQRNYTQRNYTQRNYTVRHHTDAATTQPGKTDTTLSMRNDSLELHAFYT